MNLRDKLVELLIKLLINNKNTGEVTYLSETEAGAIAKYLIANGVVLAVRCENCTHQQKVWHDDKRMKEGGFFIYSCELNDDPFVTHVVDGNPGEFCSAGKRRVEYTITTETLKANEIIRFEDLEQEV